MSGRQALTEMLNIRRGAVRFGHGDLPLDMHGRMAVQTPSIH